MSTLDETLELSPVGTLESGDSGDEALLALLAYMASSDGEVHDHELAFLQRILPGRDRDSLRAWAMEHVSASELDVDYVVGSIRPIDEQWKCLRYAARMAWKDGTVTDDERELLTRLAEGFGLPAGAVDRVLRETRVRDSARLDRDLILRAVQAPRWESVQLAGGQLVSEDLIAVLPLGADLVARVGVDRVEVMAMCTTGLVGRFAEGPAFLPWDDLVSYTRSFAIGQAITLHSEDGSSYTVVDSRMGGLALVIDRLVSHGAPEESTPEPKPPVVVLLDRE